MHGIVMVEQQISLAHFPVVLCNVKEISAVGWTMCIE